MPAAGTGLVFGVLYHNVRDSDWRAGAATLLLALLGGHALVLFAITSVGLTLPIFIAAAALIPAIRRLESVGDVRQVTKADMPGNDALPRIEVEPDTFTVRIDGEVVEPAPATELPMAQRYFLF